MNLLFFWGGSKFKVNIGTEPLRGTLSKVALDFISSSIVLRIYCPEILLKSEEAHWPCSFFGPEGRGQLKFHDHRDDRVRRARVL